MLKKVSVLAAVALALVLMLAVTVMAAPPTNEDPVAQSFKAWCEQAEKPFSGDYTYAGEKGTGTCTSRPEGTLAFSEEPTITVMLTRRYIYTREKGQTTEGWTPYVATECYYNRDYTTYDRDPLPLDDPRCFVPPEYQ